MSEPLSTLTEQERQLVMPDGTTVRPWAWYDDGPGSPYLATVKHGRTYVMGFARKGMNQAQPMFQVREGRKYGVMQTAQEIGPDWPKHPDAALIVAAVNDYDRLRASLERVGRLYHYKGDPIDHRSEVSQRHNPEDWRDCISPVCVEAHQALGYLR